MKLLTKQVRLINSLEWTITIVPDPKPPFPEGEAAIIDRPQIVTVAHRMIDGFLFNVTFDEISMNDVREVIKVGQMTIIKNMIEKGKAKL